MKCIECGKGPVEVRRENHRYTECGLDNVTLLHLEVRHCASCGEHEYVIPNIEHLHRLVANIIATKAERLVPREIRFLRKYLGYSTGDFAKAIGVEPETVSRWERVGDPKTMKLGLERLLRLMVMHEKPISSYARTNVADTATKDAAPAKIRVAPENHVWREEVRA